MDDIISQIKLEIYEDLTNTVSLQSDIISKQADAITGLITMLQQHADVDSEMFIPIKENIDEAAQIRAELEL